VAVGVERRLGGHHPGGAVVGGARQAVGALLHRVAHDVGAGHHRDAEHDREGAEGRPQLAAGQALERDARHQALTSSIAASTSACPKAPWMSPTTRPSSRKTTRSAIAAAWASCVTISVVWP